jgi:hypothetical protein
MSTDYCHRVATQLQLIKYIISYPMRSECLSRYVLIDLIRLLIFIEKYTL